MRSVFARAGLMFLILVSLDSRAAGRENVPKALQGKWRLVGFERGGVPRSPEQVPVGWISFAQDGRFAASFPDHQMGGTVTIDPAGKPAAIDFSHRRGQDQGKTMFAIYKLKGKKLVLCSAPPGKPGKERPTGFSTKGTDNVLFVFERTPFAPAPKGFDARREGIARGRVEAVEYVSKSVGGKRKLVIYTPPGYARDAKYPVLYLLHGAGQNETAWQKHGNVDAILDNLYADRKLVPMIVVMPNAATQKDAPQSDPYRPFVADLLKDIIPLVESKYPVRSDREHRAIAGLSKGGGQALWIGLKHRGRFAWVGGFSPGMNGDAKTTEPVVREVVGDLGDVRKQPQLLWLSCGDKDEFLPGDVHFHAALEHLKIPHLWHIDFGGHTWPVWKNDLYFFSQLLFRDKK